MKTYTGIGSRETPAEFITIFTKLGSWLAKKDYTLLSGHAKGADRAFEAGCDMVNGKKEVYLPWTGFDGSDSDLILGNMLNSPKAISIAEKYHPAWDKLTTGGQKLQARNTYQVLGSDLETPTSFIVCWTPSGLGSGGTGQAIRIAKDNNIPIFDFGVFGKDSQTQFVEFFSKYNTI